LFASSSSDGYIKIWKTFEDNDELEFFDCKTSKMH